jgi:hypothetical protein
VNKYLNNNFIVVNMVLFKVDFDKISWDSEGYPIGEKGHFYRGDLQERFEKRILFSMVNGEKPAYWGYDDHKERKITFCSNRYTDSFFYVERLAEKYPVNYDDLFTYFPIIMDIDLNKHKERLYASANGEGLIIKGPIDIDDITILYSSHINILEKNAPKFSDEMHRSMLIDIEGLESIHERGSPLVGIKPDFSREDLLEKYEKNSEELLSMLRYRAFGPRYTPYTDEQTQLLRNYMEVLRGKLRP